MSTLKKILSFKMNSPIGLVIIALVIAGLNFLRDYNSPRNICIRQLPADEQAMYKKILNASYKNETQKLMWESSIDALLRDCLNKQRGF